MFEVVLVRSLFLLGFTAPVLLRDRLNPFGDEKCEQLTGLQEQ